MWPRIVTQKKNCLYFHKIHFCLICSSDKVNLKKAIEEIVLNSKTVTICVSVTNVNKFREFEFIPKKVGSHFTNVCVYDVETYNKARTVPYAIGSDHFSKLFSKRNRDMSQNEI